MSGPFSARSSFFQSSPFSKAPLRTGIPLRWYRSGPGRDFHRTHLSAKRAAWGIIGINAAVFCAWTYASNHKDRRLVQELYEKATISWKNVRAGRYYTLVTSAFSHQDLRHFVFNMFALHAFATVASTVPGLGALHIVALSIGSAIAGSASFLYHQHSIGASSSRSAWGTQTINSALGASGTVMGLGAAATCLQPFSWMLVMGVVPMPLWALTLLYAGVDIWYLDSGSRIGHAAHLGGSAFGLLYYFAGMRGFGGVWYMLGRGLRR